VVAPDLALQSREAPTVHGGADGSSAAHEPREYERPSRRPEQPLLSVIVPVCDGSGMLGECLEALVASDLPREAWELIVVDDGSRDETALVAVGWADVLVRLPGPPNGPAYARNRGVEASIGEFVVFVDADVRVHPDALRRFAWAFAQQPELGAVFGSYDACTAAPGLISQYRNLLHHFIHQRGVGPKPLPLVVTHGWPGSVAEFTKIIGPLTDPARHGGDPADAFDVVAPSMPGYGFSDHPTEPGVDAERGSRGEGLGTPRVGPRLIWTRTATRSRYLPDP